MNYYFDVVDSKEKRKIYYGIVENYHGYVTATRHVGRHIGWLIYYKGKLVGCIGLGSYFLPEPKTLKEYIGWGKKAFNENFNKVANNWRFTLMPNAPKNAGSKCLSLLAKIAPKAWHEKYGDTLVFLVSLVGEKRKGTCFKAAGWKMVGLTAGSTAHGSISVKKTWKKKGFEYGGSYKRSKKEQKLIFVKPVHPQWKLILNCVSLN